MVALSAARIASMNLSLPSWIPFVASMLYSRVAFLDGGRSLVVCVPCSLVVDSENMQNFIRVSADDTAPAPPDRRLNPPCWRLFLHGRNRPWLTVSDQVVFVGEGCRGGA